MKELASARSSFRWLLLAAAVLAALLWLSSLAFVIDSSARGKTAAIDLSQPLDPVSAPNWRDALLVRIAITDTAIQQQRGVVQWQAGERLGRTPLTVVADGRLRTIVLPIGIHPDWLGNVENVRIVFPKQNELEFVVTQAEMVERSPFALDALVGRALAPVTVTLPSFQSLILLTALILIVCLTLVAPSSGAFTQRRVLIGLIALVCIAASLSTIVEQSRLLPRLWQSFAGLDEPALALFVPHYADSAQVNSLLVEAAHALPDGDVLVLDAGPPASYLKVRSLYLLYPRQVTFAAPQSPQRPQAFVGVIQPANGRPPALGWQRVAGPLAGWEAWRAPGLPLPLPLPRANWSAWPQFLLAVSIVVFVGLSLAGLLGWQGVRGWASALTLGAGVLAWWMMVLSSASLPWTPASIALPLLGAGVAFMAIARRVQLPARAKVKEPAYLSKDARVVSALATLLVAFLFVCVVVQAGLLPFSDQDSWTTWGFNGRALFAEGSVQRFLARHGAGELNHASYPPGLPLFNAWVYLALNGVSERLVKLVMPLWWLSLIGLMWGEARRLTGTWAAVGLTFLVATTPLFLDHATLGNADLPFTVALFTAAIALTGWIRAGARRELVGAVIALAVAAWIKLDGIHLGVALLFCAGLGRALRCHQSHQTDIAQCAAGQVVIAMTALIALYAPWPLLTHAAGIVGETPSLAMVAVSGLPNFVQGVRIILSELLVSHNNSTWSLLGSGYHLLWPICLIVLLIQSHRLSRDPLLFFLVASTLSVIVFYTLIYVLRPYFSVERYLMHAAPLAVLTAVYAMRNDPACEGTAKSSQ